MPQDIRKIQSVQKFLLDTSIYQDYRTVAKKHGIKEDRVGEFLDLADAVIKGQLTVDKMPALCAQAFGLDEKKSQALAADIAGYRLLPLEKYIEGVPKAIKEWSGKIEDYPEFRVKKEVRAADEFIRELADEIDLQLPEHLMKRFVYLCRGYLTKKRAREATIELMKRRLNIGGLELDQEAAENVLKLLDKEAHNYRVVADKAAKEEAQAEKELVKKDESAAAAPQFIAKSKMLQALAEFDQQPSNKSKPTQQQTTQPTKPAQPKRRPVGQRVAAVMDPEEKAPPESAQKKSQQPRPEQKNQKLVNQILKPLAQAYRAKHIPRRAYIASVGAYLRGQENINQLKETLVEYKFTPAEIDQYLEIAQKAQAAATGKKNPPSPGQKKSLPAKAVSHALTKEVPVVSGSILDDSEEEELKQHRQQAKKAGDQVGSGEETQKLVNAELKPAIEVFKKKRIAKKKFQELAKAHIRGIREPLRTEQLLKDKHKLSGDDLKTVMKALEAARKIAQGQTQVQTSAVKSVTEAKPQKDIFAEEAEVLDQRHAAMTQKLPEKKVEPPAPQARVSAARTKAEELELQKKKVDQGKLKAAEQATLPKPAKVKLSKPSAPPQQKGKVQDVKFTRKLTGPVEELAKTGLAEFRRLSTDPVEAARKIEDKLELLEQTAYEERIKGVKAWRQSPINQLYLQMTQESLQKGVSLAEIASTRRNSGEEALSPAEITAIVALNNRIKF